MTTQAEAGLRLCHGLGLAAVLSVVLGGVGLGTTMAAPGAAAEGSALDGKVRPPAGTGRPVCVHVGTRSEGWAWPNGRFIGWAKCAGVIPECKPAGPRGGEGWYANGALIGADECTKPGDTYRVRRRSEPSTSRRSRARPTTSPSTAPSHAAGTYTLRVDCACN